MIPLAVYQMTMIFLIIFLMNKETENFKNKVNKKYPNAIFNIDNQNNIIVILKENEQIRLIGCSLCFDPMDIRLMNNKVVIKDIDAIPITAICEDDSYNPLMNALFLCPICSRIITHPNILNKSIIANRFEDTWKD